MHSSTQLCRSLLVRNPSALESDLDLRHGSNMLSMVQEKSRSHILWRPSLEAHPFGCDNLSLQMISREILSGVETAESRVVFLVPGAGPTTQ